MADSSGPENSEDLLSEVERLKIENLLLVQDAKFNDKFQGHIEAVEKQISKGNIKLGLVGLLALGVACLGTYQKVEERVQERLDKEFGNQQIQELISRSATTAAREIIKKRLSESTDSENVKLKCAVDKQGRDLFVLECRLDGGHLDENRGRAVCVDANKGETYYDTLFPEVDCDKTLAGNAVQAHARTNIK